MKVIELDGLTVELIRKNVKNVRLRVEPPGGRVVVTAPHLIRERVILRFINEKRGWIDKHREKFASLRREPPRLFEDEEVHELFGKDYILRVSETGGRQKISLSGDLIVMTAKEGSGIDERRELLNKLYRQKLKESIPGLIEKWEPVMGVSVSGFGIRKMKTRWGTCNTSTGKIWVNLELAKRHPDYLEYLVVHEMCHLLERSHNRRYKSLMDGFLPNWRSLRGGLNRFPLANTDEHSRRD